MALYCVNPDSSRGARSTSRKINRAHRKRTWSASDYTRGPRSGSSTLTLRALRLCFQHTVTEKPATCWDAELLCPLLLLWKPCHGDVGRNEDFEKRNIAWKTGAFHLYIFKKSYDFVKHKCMHFA